MFYSFRLKHSVCVFPSNNQEGRSSHHVFMCPCLTYGPMWFTCDYIPKHKRMAGLGHGQIKAHGPQNFKNNLHKYKL